MIRARRKGRPVFIFMLLVALSIALPYHYALAALVPTELLSDSAAAADARGRLMQYLAARTCGRHLLRRAWTPRRPRRGSRA